MVQICRFAAWGMGGVARSSKLGLKGFRSPTGARSCSVAGKISGFVLDGFRSALALFGSAELPGLVS